MYSKIKRNVVSSDKVKDELFKTNLKNLALSSFFKYNNSKHSQSLNPLTRAEQKALSILRRNKDIVILKPDKGNGVVILNKTDYINKVESLLSDKSKFGPTKEDDPLKQVNFLQEKLRVLLRKLKDKGSISSQQYDLVYPQGSQLGVMYGSPKIHKAGCPVRPILSSINTANYRLAKFLVTVLQPISAKTLFIL